MVDDAFVSLSTVSLRLIKQPEHRPEFQEKLEKELREILLIPKTVAVTTMPDTPLWWQRAKAIAEKMETERKYAEEHPECAKSPNGKHEWRFGTCVWCGTSATEVKTEEIKEKERLPWQSWIQPLLEYITNMTTKEGWAKHEDIHREMESIGMTHEEVDKVVAQLEREGTIYEPRSGFYRKTTPCPVPEEKTTIPEQKEGVIAPNVFQDPHLGRCTYQFFYITNDIYGGYSAHCERGAISVDYADARKVIDMAEKAEMVVSLSGEAWKEIGKHGFGEIVYPLEARDLVKKLAQKKVRGH